MTNITSDVLVKNLKELYNSGALEVEGFMSGREILNNKLNADQMIQRANLEAVKKSYLIIQCIIDITEEIKAEIFKQAGGEEFFNDIIKNTTKISRMSKRAVLESLIKNGLVPFLVQEEQDEQESVEAVKKHSHALGYIKNQTDKVIQTAINEGGYYSFQYIENQTEKLCFQYLKRFPHGLLEIRKPTKEMKFYAKHWEKINALNKAIKKANRI